MFSPADYELAARVTGLPVPKTDAERAAAAPVVAQILREYNRALPAAPGFEDPNMRNMGATRSLNAPPNVTQPEVKIALERRLQAGVVDPDDMAEAAELAEMLTENPGLVDFLLELIQEAQMTSEASGEFLSQQRPMEYDMPNYGGQYSVLNAPNTTQVPASIRYQALS